MWNEFKEFALKANIVELAVAVVIGVAFGQIVTSLVDQIIMPLIGIVLGGVNFSTLSIQVGDAVVQYGIFIQSVIDFFIIAFAVFLFVKFFNRFKKKEEATVEEELNEQVELLKEIRDLMKKDSII